MRTCELYSESRSLLWETTRLGDRIDGIEGNIWAEKGEVTMGMIGVLCQGVGKQTGCKDGAECGEDDVRCQRCT